LQLVVGLPCQSPAKCRAHQRHLVAAHQAPASIRRRIRSDGHYLALDPNLKFAYSAPVSAYPHRKTPPSTSESCVCSNEQKIEVGVTFPYLPRHKTRHERQSHLQHSSFIQVSQSKSGPVMIICFKSLIYFYVVKFNINIDQELQ
jgi:hypothetical protein